MDILMTREALSKILENALNLGRIDYIDMITPEYDKIKQREAQRYLKRRGYEPKVLDEWRNMGLIHRRKDGARNSPVYYSLKEIQKQITITEMSKGNIRTHIPKLENREPPT